MSWTNDGGADPRRIIAKREIRDSVVCIANDERTLCQARSAETHSWLPEPPSMHYSRLQYLLDNKTR